MHLKTLKRTFTSCASNAVVVHRLGRMDFAEAFKLQKQLMTATDPLYHTEDHLLFVEHPSVYTCGRRHFVDIDQYINPQASEYHDGFKEEIQKIDRGGNVTYHGEGQLVVYPIFDLSQSHFKKDLHWYLRTIEDVIIDWLLNGYRLKTEYNFDCYHDPQYTGVWLKNDVDARFANRQYKICAIGIGCTRWKTYHGLAFNVSADLNHFNKIVPCGIFESSKTVINLMDVAHSGSDNDKHNKPKPLTCDHNLRFNDNTNQLIDQLIPLFESHFKIKCYEQ